MSIFEKLAKRYLARRGYTVAKGADVSVFTSSDGYWQKPDGVSFVEVTTTNAPAGGGGGTRKPEGKRT